MTCLLNKIDVFVNNIFSLNIFKLKVVHSDQLHVIQQPGLCCPIKPPRKTCEYIIDHLQSEHLCYYTVDSKKWLHTFHCNGISSDLQEIHFLPAHCEAWWKIINMVHGLTARDTQTYKLWVMKTLNEIFM